MRKICITGLGQSVFFCNVPRSIPTVFFWQRPTPRNAGVTDVWGSLCTRLENASIRTSILYIHKRLFFSFLFFLGC